MNLRRPVAEIPEASREGFEGWVLRVAFELAPGVGFEDHASALAFLLGGEALGLVEEHGRELPGFYVRGRDRLAAAAGKRERGEELLFHLYARYWRPADGDDVWVYSGCYPDEDEGWVHGLDPTPGPGVPLGTVVFRADNVSLDDLACRTEADLYGVYGLVGSATTPEVPARGSS